VVDATDGAITEVRRLGFAGVVESEPEEQTKAISRAQKVMDAR